jgi:Tol biopolymer transport system component
LAQVTQDAWGSATHPSFSPDGGRLVYTGAGGGGRRQIYAIGVGGSGRMNLSNNAYDEWEPVWVK